MSRFIPRAGGFAKPNKFGAQRVTLTAPDGREMTFPSRMQAAYVATLWRREAAGEIYALELEPSWPIHIAQEALVGGFAPVKVGVYKPDAVWMEDVEGVPHMRVVDIGTKNTKTPVKMFKLRCIEAEYGVKVDHVSLTRAQTDRALAVYAAAGVRPLREVAA